MYHLYQTEAFILDERPLGEANRLYFLLTPDWGLVTATAQGVRLLKSKLRFQLNKYSYVNVVLVRGKEIWRLVGAEKIGGFEAIYESPIKLQFAAKIFTLLRRFVQGETSQRKLFDDLIHSLLFLSALNLSAMDPKLLSSWEQLTVLRSLHFWGYIKDLPKLDPFLSFTEWSEDILMLAAVSQSFLIGVINEAIEVSHI